MILSPIAADAQPCCGEITSIVDLSNPSRKIARPGSGQETGATFTGTDFRH
jgi:tRNA A37 threonylcarbamoyladenosine synthetase subunit TsaC/SUA5/YrdC